MIDIYAVGNLTWPECPTCKFALETWDSKVRRRGTEWLVDWRCRSCGFRLNDVSTVDPRLRAELSIQAELHRGGKLVQ